MMSFSQINQIHQSLPHWIEVLLSSSHFLCHPRIPIRIFLDIVARKCIPDWEPSPNRAAIGFSQIAFPITVLPKDGRTDFVQREKLGFRCSTKILATCVEVDVSKCLDIPIWEFSVIWVHPPF